MSGRKTGEKRKSLGRNLLRLNLEVPCRIELQYQVLQTCA